MNKAEISGPEGTRILSYSDGSIYLTIETGVGPKSSSDLELSDLIKLVEKATGKVLWDPPVDRVQVEKIRNAMSYANTLAGPQGDLASAAYRAGVRVP